MWHSLESRVYGEMKNKIRCEIVHTEEDKIITHIGTS
jgi:hypothetical protein